MNLKSLVPIEFKNQRVLLTSQLAESYETTPDIISQNFKRNQKRYKEGKDYYCLKGEELKSFKANLQFDDQLKFSTVLYLWTEHGSLRHAKSLGTDKAWEVYDLLEDTYFRVRDLAAKPAYDLPKSYPEALRTLADKVEEIERDKPKVQYFDEIVDRNLLTNIRDTAKELHVKQTDFVNSLLDSKFLYRDGNGKLKPYAAKNDGLFELKERINKKTDWVGNQLFVTPKGRETFRLLLKGNTHYTAVKPNNGKAA